jgi:hypothetical protein
MDAAPAAAPTDAGDGWEPMAAPAESAKSDAAPGGSTFMQRLGKVWDNPTPGGLVSVIKGIYNGLEGGAKLTKDVMQGNVDPLSDEAVQQAADTASVVLPGAKFPVPIGPSKLPTEAVQAATRLGMTLPKYMATDGQVLPALASGAKAIPGGAGPIERSAQGVRDALQTAVNSTRGTPGDTSISTAGAIAGDALERGVKDAQGRVGAAYDAVNDALDDPNARVPLANTAQTMQTMMNQRKEANLPQWGPAMQTLASAVTDPQGMNYNGIKTLRSYLGESHPQTLVAEGLNPTDVKRLYGPLTQDLTAAVHAGGGDEALTAWQEANELARTTAGNRDQIYKVIGERADKSPESTYGALARMAGNGPAGDIGTLRTAMSYMGQSGRSAVADAWLSQNGHDEMGNFTPAKFVSAYQKLSSDAKDAIFTPQQKSRLDDVVTVSNQVKEKLDKFSNTSRTVPTLTHAGITATFLHPVLWPKILSAIAGARGTAMALSRPAYNGAPLSITIHNNPALRGLLSAYDRGAVGGLLSP